MRPPRRLTPRAFAAALRTLAATDRDLARVLETHGPPPMWLRPPGFASLVLIILEQQVSLASARAAYARLATLVRPLTPERLLDTAPERLVGAGLTRQKRAYCLAVARAVAEGHLALDALEGLDDAAAHAALTAVKGIGAWTADVYLLMGLARPDVWPAGDRALQVACGEVKGLEPVPDARALAPLGEAWRPWRAVAARVLWHHYLSTPRRRRPGQRG